MPSSTADIRAEILAHAATLGFDAVRIASAEEAPDTREHLSAFLAEGRHGTMDWMEKNAEKRAAPVSLWPEAKSVVVVAQNYAPARDPREALAERTTGAISAYAQGDDYHDVMKAKLRRLAHFVHTRFGAEVKLFVDTAPVMEKPLAQTAGLGWQGKHTNLVSREFGSWLFLGSLFTTLELPADPPEEDHCGQCRRCLDVCPTNAFTAPYRIDARRCIAYLTIENKDHISREFREAIGNRIYGCDDCLAVCPWNKFAQEAHEARFHARDALRAPALSDLAVLDDAGFRALFRGSPIKRIGRDRFVRNVLIAIGNSEDVSLAPCAEHLLDDASPLVRAMAVWALSRLLDDRSLSVLATKYESGESDDGVRTEWRLARENA
ncbi:MAG TPA: tRNA epoxyqueuosine(34) reductase QueG [Rhizomicrobium sp.]|nr:tRNA epoxyqueuosine(34) reductase QueG [Rhizomicrobium sp.]